MMHFKHIAFAKKRLAAQHIMSYIKINKQTAKRKMQNTNTEALNTNLGDGFRNSSTEKGRLYSSFTKWIKTKFFFTGTTIGTDEVAEVSDSELDFNIFDTKPDALIEHNKENILKYFHC